MKKIIIILSILVIAIVAGYLIWTNYSPATPPFSENNLPENNLVGGDKDAHGCIGSAGYSWCELKNKCLRIWEEACDERLQQEIQSLLAEKYKKPIEQVKITISEQIGDYVSGGIKFSADPQTAGGMFLAAKINNKWQVVYDGNGSVDCLKLRQEYKFPDEILKPNFCD